MYLELCRTFCSCILTDQSGSFLRCSATATLVLGGESWITTQLPCRWWRETRSINSMLTVRSGSLLAQLAAATRVPGGRSWMLIRVPSKLPLVRQELMAQILFINCTMTVRSGLIPVRLAAGTHVQDGRDSMTTPALR